MSGHGTTELSRLLDDYIKLGETEYGRQQDVVVQSLKINCGESFGVAYCGNYEAPTAVAGCGSGL